jgi:hypothetical protein
MLTTLIANFLDSFILIICNKSCNYEVPRAILFYLVSLADVQIFSQAPCSQTPTVMSFYCGLTPDTGVCIDCSGPNVEVIMTSHLASRRSSAFLFHIQEIQDSHPGLENSKSWLRVLVVLRSHSVNIPDYYNKLEHNCFLPHPLQSIRLLNIKRVYYLEIY